MSASASPAPSGDAAPGALATPVAIPPAVGGRSSRRRCDGYAALRCAAHGETTHIDGVCQGSARGLQDLAVRRKPAIGCCTPTAEDEAQALTRAEAARKYKDGKAVRACRLATIDPKRQPGPDSP